MLFPRGKIQISRRDFPQAESHCRAKKQQQQLSVFSHLNPYRLQERPANKQLVNCKKWQKEEMPLHKAPDLGVGEGVSVQYVSDPRAPPRDQQERQPDRQAGQDLVSEPQDETEENEQGKPHP